MAKYIDFDQENPEDGVMLEDVEVVYQSLGNILSTSEGERFFNDLSSDLESLLFEPMTDLTVTRIKNFVVDAIENHEDRVQLNYGKSTVIPDYEAFQYEVNLVFTVIGFKDEHDFTKRLSKLT